MSTWLLRAAYTSGAIRLGHRSKGQPNSLSRYPFITPKNTSSKCWWEALYLKQQKNDEPRPGPTTSLKLNVRLIWARSICVPRRLLRILSALQQRKPKDVKFLLRTPELGVNWK